MVGASLTDVGLEWIRSKIQFGVELFICVPIVAVAEGIEKCIRAVFTYLFVLIDAVASIEFRRYGRSNSSKAIC